MRIIYHHRTRGQDAQGVHIRGICDAFEAAGHKVKVIGVVGGGIDCKDVNVRRHDQAGSALFGIRIPHWGYELLAIMYNFPAFFRLFYSALRFKPDFIYERYSLFNMSGVLVAKLLRTPLILEVNAPLCEEMKEHDGLTFQRLACRFENLILSWAFKVVAVSGVLRAIFVRRGIAEAKFIVMHNGVDRRVFHAGVKGLGVRKKFGIDDNFVIGFVGWIRPWHNVDALVRAVANLIPAYSDLRLLIVGDGPAMRDLESLVKALNVESAVVFAGAVAEDLVPTYIGAMDVAVQPNVTEYASPIKLFEYLAMGRAVLAPRKTNIEEIVCDGETAILFTPGNISELENAIRKLYVDRVLLSRLKLAAIELGDRRGYFWESNAQRVIAALGQDSL